MSRFGYVVTTYVAVLAIGVLSFVHFAPKLIWNASASTPIGLYAVAPTGQLRVAELVAINPPEPLASFLAARGYLPRGVPLMKRIAALPGQRVCRAGSTITIDGVVMGEALARDRRGRSLPSWQGCRVIAAGDIFVMNEQVRDSLDGRYFGPLSTRSIVGQALALWTDAEGDGRYRWRAPSP